MTLASGQLGVPPGDCAITVSESEEISGGKEYRLEYRVQTANGAGLGSPNDWGPNIYAQVSIYKLG